MTEQSTPSDLAAWVLDHGVGLTPARQKQLAKGYRRLEAQSDIRGRAVVMYRERAREAEAERDYWKREHAELRDELVATQEHGATMAHGRDDALHETAEAEARVDAVRALHTGTRWPGVADKPICDACDQMWPCDTIRALDGTDTPPAAG